MAKRKISLGPGQMPNIMPHYPHMLNEDRDIWTKFLERAEFEIDRVWYDVHCGLALPVLAGKDSMEYKISQGVTRKRVDVICRVGGEIWIVEIKPHANMKALGQIITYEKLIRREYLLPGKLVPVILCWTVDQDVAETLEAFGARILHPEKPD